MTEKLHKVYATKLNKYLIYHHMENKLKLTKKQKLPWVETYKKRTIERLHNNFENSGNEDINEFSSDSDQDEVILAEINETEDEEDDEDDVSPNFLLCYSCC